MAIYTGKADPGQNNCHHLIHKKPMYISFPNSRKPGHFNRLIHHAILFLLLWASATVFQSCSSTRRQANESKEIKPVKQSSKSKHIPAVTINTRNVPADTVVTFAKTLIGTRYKYGSADKEQGFDCSGFITYVFSHFGIKVPRSSIDFTNAGKEVPLKDSRKGDLILFTGSDASSGVVGHMGIISQHKNGKLYFIHSASGNSKGVMISDMNSYFTPRFVKVIRVFNE